MIFPAAGLRTIPPVCISSDHIIGQYAPEIHISTQAGIVNYQAANAFYEMGAKRIVTARELSLDEIRTIRDKTNPDLEIEVKFYFSHINNPNKVRKF